jgi:ssDNA-binding Zn-finger/Zn-ribbon topoisomerase 1
MDHSNYPICRKAKAKANANAKTKSRKHNQPCQFSTRPYDMGRHFLLVNGYSALIGLLDS